MYLYIAYLYEVVMSERKLSPEDGGAKHIARFNIMQAIETARTSSPTASPTLPTQSPHQPQAPVPEDNVVDEHLAGVRKLIQEESKHSFRSPPSTTSPRPPRSPRISPTSSPPTNSPPTSRYIVDWGQ